MLGLLGAACSSAPSDVVDVAAEEAVPEEAVSEESSGAVDGGGGSDETFGEEEASDAGAVTTPIRIANQGGSLEGHTPREFAGSGTGLFAGDNLNPNFPNGVGIQILLTFDLPPGQGQPNEVRLVSDALTERGNAFEALGPLQAEPVTYEAFGPPLFSLAADGPATECNRVGDTGIDCDVTAAASEAIAAGAERFQVRVQFANQSDSDGEQDLALFFLTDSNTNEPGIFFLEVS